MRILGNMLHTLYAAAITALQNLVITTTGSFQVVSGGSVQIGSSSSTSISSTTSTSLSAPSGVTVTDGTGTQWGAPTGGAKGAGTVNTAGLFINGVAVVVNAGNGQIITDSSGMLIGSPTGGSQGANTINAVGLFVNGVAVATGGSGGVGSITVANKTHAQATTRSSVSLLVDGQLVSSSLVAGTYRVDIVGLISSSNGTSGIQFNLAGGSATISSAIGQASCFSSGLAFQGADYNSFAGSTSTFSTITSAGTIFRFSGEVVVTATGTIGFSWTPANAGSTTLDESHMVLTRVA